MHYEEPREYDKTMITVPLQENRQPFIRVKQELRLENRLIFV